MVKDVGAVVAKVTERVISIVWVTEGTGIEFGEAVQV